MLSSCLAQPQTLTIFVLLLRPLERCQRTVSLHKHFRLGPYKVGSTVSPISRRRELSVLEFEQVCQPVPPVCSHDVIAFMCSPVQCTEKHARCFPDIGGSGCISGFT